MNKLKYILILMVILISCEKDIEIALDKQSNHLVMYSFIYPDSALNIHLSKSQSILSLSDYENVKNGYFRLSVNENNIGTYSLPHDTVWSRWPDFGFKHGDKILLEAFDEAGGTVKVETIIPEVVRFNLDDGDTSRITVNVADKGPVDMLQTQISFNDPVDEENFYQLHIVRESWGYINEEPFYHHEAVQYDKVDPVFKQRDQSGSLLKGFDFQGLFYDGLINGYYYPLVFNIPYSYLLFNDNEDKIRITMYLYHHTYDYYSFFRSSVLAAGYEGIYEGLPIFEPVRVYNNVVGGLGLVSGMSFHADSLVIYK